MTKVAKFKLMMRSSVAAAALFALLMGSAALAQDAQTSRDSKQPQQEARPKPGQGQADGGQTMQRAQDDQSQGELPGSSGAHTAHPDVLVVNDQAAVAEEDAMVQVWLQRALAL